MVESSISGEDDSPTNLPSMYIWLNQNASKLPDLRIGADKFKAVAKRLRDEGDEEGARVAWWEMNAFDLEIGNGELTWQFSGTDDNGHPLVYPNLEELGGAAFDYFAKRQSEVTDSALKARYSHILWQSPKKHVRFAEDASQAYLELVRIYELLDKDNPKTHFGRSIISSIETAFLLSIKSKGDLTKSKAEIFRLLEDYPQTSSSWFRLRYDLVNLLLKNKKSLLGSELAYIPDLCDATANILLSGNIHSAITILELGLEADLKLGLHTRDWNRKIAEAYETLMNCRDNEPLVGSHFCEKALQHYRKIKEQAKIDELERRRQQYSRNIRMQSVGEKIDLTEHIQRCKMIANRIGSQDTAEIVAGLATDQTILPNPDDMITLAKEGMTKHPLLSFVPETILDARGHIVQYVDGPEEKLKSELLKTFDYFMRMDKIHLIHEVIIACLRSGNLTLSSLMEHLHVHSWLCQPLKYEVAGHVFEYRWIDVLEPGLRAYFETIQEHIDNRSASDSLMLAIDSLSVKFEGLIRDLYCLHGNISTFDREVKGGRMITQEKDINTLLYEQAIEQLLGYQDVLFLKYLLIEKLGMNLRNRVAHCLLNRDDYDLGKAHLVFLGILRLARFRLNLGG